MSFEPNQFRDLIRRVLVEAALMRDMDNAVELLMMTAAVESNLGRYLRQVKGPALGVFQMEPATYHDLYRNYIDAHPEIDRAAVYFRALGGPEEMEWNLAYAIVIARINYLRSPTALPDHSDIWKMAAYWKRYWNTNKGTGTVEQAVTNYMMYQR